MAREPTDRLPPQDVAAVVIPLIEKTQLATGRAEETEGLARALGVDLAFVEHLNVRKADAGKLFGGGQLESLAERLEEACVTLLVVDCTLSPVQQRNLERILQLKVVDRTGLILEIFGLRARTAEGRLQVELARQLYERSRLVRTWTHLERQRGGVGFLGGPGETQIEADRRMLNTRINRLKADLEDVRRRRQLQRSGRAKRESPIVALVGYTNAGKSTLFNQMTGANVMAADMPFATLDPTVRDVEAGNGRTFTLIDTVGFITDLPPHLVAAFRATLEEAMDADLLLHVRDIADADTAMQAAEVESVLEQLAKETGESPPIVEVWNKADMLSPTVHSIYAERAAEQTPPALLVSAQNGDGLDLLLASINTRLFPDRKQRHIILEPAQGRLRSWLHEHCEVIDEQFGENGANTSYELNVRMTDRELTEFESMRTETALLDG